MRHLSQPQTFMGTPLILRTIPMGTILTGIITTTPAPHRNPRQGHRLRCLPGTLMRMRTMTLPCHRPSQQSHPCLRPLPLPSWETRQGPCGEREGGGSDLPHTASRMAGGQGVGAWLTAGEQREDMTPT